MASINGINNTIPANNFTVPAGTITASGNITSSAGYVEGVTGLGAGAAPSTSGLVVSLPNRIGAWITGTNISTAGVDADGLFIDTSFAPTMSLGTAASIGLYPTFNPPGGVTITMGAGLYIAAGTQGGAGTTTTGYGLYVAHPAFGATNYAAQIDNIRIDVNTIEATNANGTLNVNSAGVGTLSLGTNATAHSTVLGSTTASATTTIQAPSGGVVLTGVQGVSVSNKNYVTIDTSTGAIGSDAGPMGGIVTLNGDSGSATGSTVTITTAGTFGESVSFTGSGSTITFATTDAGNNVAIGNGAGAALAGSNSCAFYGYQSGFNTATNACTFYGFQSGFNNVGGYFNTCVGYQSGANLGGGIQNTLVGTQLGPTAVLTGNNNVGIGLNSLFALASGSDNSCLGTGSGSNYTSSESSNICIGNIGTVGESNTLRIGQGTGSGTSNLNFAFIAGIRGITTVNNDAVAVLIDSADQLGTVSSSIRYKENIQDMREESSGLLKLRPVSFNYKEKKYKSTGLIAEEVLKVMPELVANNKEGKPESVKYHELPALLLNELQKALKRIDALEAKLKG